MLTTHGPHDAAALVPTLSSNPANVGVELPTTSLDRAVSTALEPPLASRAEEYHGSQSSRGAGQHQLRRSSPRSANLSDVTHDLVGTVPLTVEPMEVDRSLALVLPASSGFAPVASIGIDGAAASNPSAVCSPSTLRCQSTLQSVRSRRLDGSFTAASASSEVGHRCNLRYDPTTCSTTSTGAKRSRSAIELESSPHPFASPPPRPLPGGLPRLAAPSYPRAWHRSPEAAAVYASFTWPLTHVSEVQRLLTTCLAPTWLMLGDSSTAWTSQMECTHGVIALVVDRIPPSVECLAYCGEFHDVLHLQLWDGICAWPSCTHQAVSNAHLLEDKRRDGRMFFGLVGVLYVMFYGRARVRMVEQPVTTLSRYFSWHTYHLRTSRYGDCFDKTICLRLVGMSLHGLESHQRPPDGPLVTRLPHWSFVDAAARESYRSSWLHFPLFLVALAACMFVTVEPPPPPTFREAVETLAVAWYRAGHPLPADYDSPDGLPGTADRRAYQRERGAGDGQRIVGVIPHSLRISPAPTAPPVLDESRLMDLVVSKSLLLSMLSMQGFMLFFLSVTVQPLLLAPLTGLHVIGAELPVSLSPRAVALPLMEEWASSVGGAAAAATTFLIGRYSSGPRIGVTVLPIVPAEASIARTTSDVQRLRRAGRTTAWLTMAALSTLAIADAGARVFAGAEAFVKPVSRLADFAVEGSSFHIGAAAPMSLQPSPRLMMARTSASLLLDRDASNALLLRRALLAQASSEDAPLFDGWAERIRPPLVELQSELVDLLPDFSDPQLLDLAYTAPYVPPQTRWLPRMPPQLPRVTPFCVRDPMQLLDAVAQRRVQAWLGKALDQLLCIERGEDNCELRRPHPIAIGQRALLPWARGVIWDFTFERAPCAVPLDLTLPLESNLKLDVLHHRLRAYPDQELVSHLIEGVRLGGDVELQTVLVPHLISLPLGFTSVRDELYRMQKLDWYRFFDHVPFWPMYFNGQGAAARKHSTRYRRSTECGGPRKECLDESGLAAISLNDAAVLNHFPQWYSIREGEPVWDAWLEIKGILDPATREIPSPRLKEIKPTLAQIMFDLSILLAAGRLLDEPVYIFGDDAKDHFNQLALAPEAWNQLGVVFLHQMDDLSRDQPPHARLFFVSERRLGFGAKLSSLIAQRFSEAVLSLFRADMDAAEAAVPVDQRPSAQEWRARRRAAAATHKGNELEFLRLYFVVMYTDDAILCVVGVDRAIRLLRCWQRLIASIGLLMAPPEKRNVGTWAPWLGVIIFAGIGLVLVPKDKLLRTAARLTSILQGTRTEFSEYRSLIGMLEHLRCVNCAPGSVMYGLYTPHKTSAIQLEGPSTFIRCTVFMLHQLQRWLDLLKRTGGAVVTAAIRGLLGMASLTYVVSSDAATDSHPPGMGGFCHGLYWYLEIKDEWLRWLHITVFELLATGGSAMTFESFIAHADRKLYLADALATPFVLARHKGRSDMLTMAHHELLAQPQYTNAMEHAVIDHFAGDCNVFSDAVSRSLWKRFELLCQSLVVQPKQVDPAPALLQIIERLVAYAKALGRPIRPNVFHRAAPTLPLAMLARGRHSTACEEADAVAISARLLRRMHGNASAASVATVIMHAPSTSSISPRLHAAMRTVAPSVTVKVDPSPPPDTEACRLRRRRKPKRATVRACPAQTKPALSNPPPAVRRQKLSRPLQQRADLLVPPPRAPGSTEHKKRKASALLDAARTCAATRAEGFAAAGFARSAHGHERLTRLLQQAVDLSDYGSSYNTRAIDETAWMHWSSFAEYIDLDPVFSPEQVRDHPAQIGTILATFLLWVYPKMKGKQGRAWAKPRSAMAYVLAIIRIFRGWKLILPPAKVVKNELHGLLRSFVNVYGVHALMPRRREPMKYVMIRAMQDVHQARLGNRSYDAQSAIGLAFRGILAVGWRTGHRLAEFVAHPSGELCYLTRGSVSYVIGGVTVTDPTAAQLAQLRPGDLLLIQPPRSKTDQFGEIHCPFPSSIPYSTDPHSAGFILAMQDRDSPCRGLARTTRPLFADEHGQPYTHAVLDRLLDHMLTLCFGAKIASCYSWHSLRIGLATALKAANVDNDIIQMICRWTNPESLRAYARHGQSLHISCVDQAERAVIDAIQAANVPIVCNTEGAVAMHLEYAQPVSPRVRAVLDAADDDATVNPAAARVAADTTPLRSAGCIGRRVLVPAHVWPTFPCTENAGTGWTATIVACTRNAATVHFMDAVTARGLPYADVQLTLDALSPI